MLSAVARSPGPDIRSLTLIRCAPNEAAPAAGGRGGRRKASVFGAGAAPRGYPQGRGSYGGGGGPKTHGPPVRVEGKAGGFLVFWAGGGGGHSRVDAG